MSAIIEATGVSKRFGGLKAVEDVSLAVPPGEISALIGPNGAGKTTLFTLLAGFQKPDTGHVRFAGRDITALPAHAIARLGMARTFQIVQPFAGQTVRENIAVGAHLRIPGREAALARAEAVARRVGLSDQLDKPAADMTVAGRKRLELARALATGPQLLLLDEVLAGLNPQEIAGMIPVIRAICAGGDGEPPVTVLMIEHVMQAVMNLAARVWVLSQGRLIASGSPAEVTSDPAVIEAYLGHGAAARLAAQKAG
jgi:branched-chain amino acid transport system ATP-binding protein